MWILGEVLKTRTINENQMCLKKEGKFFYKKDY